MPVQHFIIYHGVDADGWMSAAICEMFIEHDLKREFESYPYNYGWDMSHLEEKLNKLKEENIDFLIFMVDCTLPDEFMRKYGNHIYLMDHHQSSIENMEKTGLKDELFKFASKINLNGYLDTKGNEATQISASELVWKELFPNKQMPNAVRIVGRYDVWDHDELETTHDLNMFIRIQSYKPENKFVRQHENWFKLMIIDENFLKECIKEGQTARKYKNLFDKQDALISTKFIMTKNGKTIAITNRGCINSTFFSSIAKKYDVVACIAYTHILEWNQFRLSIYTLKNNFNALFYMNKVLEDIVPFDEIKSSGGHRNACGCVLTNEGFEKFINAHSFIEPRMISR